LTSTAGTLSFAWLSRVCGRASLTRVFTAGPVRFGQRHRFGERTRAGGEGGRRHLASGATGLGLRPLAPRRHQNAELYLDLDQTHVAYATAWRDVRDRGGPDLFVPGLPTNGGASASHGMFPGSGRSLYETTAPDSFRFAVQ